MPRIGMDFDGTIAVWPQGTKPNYNDPNHAMANAAALPAAIKWIQHQIKAGHQITIITGRDIRHHAPLERWFRIFLRQTPIIHCRPLSIGLSCSDQARWKFQVLIENDIAIYIGDNPLIDEAAAKMAGIPYIDAACFLRGELPTIQGGNI
jgi:hypothetical protein